MIGYAGEGLFRGNTDQANREKSLFQQPECIVSVNLAQDIVRQINSLDLPAPLAGRMRWVVEVLVRRFQKSEVQAVHGFFRHQVGAKQDAVRELEKKSTRGIGLAPEFRGPCTDIEQDVRVVFQ